MELVLSSQSLVPGFAVDRDSTVPLWLQLMRAIEQAIASGHWAPGDRLPTERDFCSSFSISRTSVRAALEKLEEAGLISRRQGAGAFVEAVPAPWSWTMPGAASVFDPFERAGASPLASKVLRAGIEPLPPFVSAAFGSPNGVGTVIERVRSVKSLPALHVVNYLPRAFAGVIPDLRDPHASLYAALARVADVHIARMHRTVEAALADRQMARLLAIEEGHPVVVVELVAYDATGAPVDISKATVRTDRLRITVDSGHDDDVSNGATLTMTSRVHSEGDTT
ncbi:MAG: GntR family transcriptional regulator [Actinomycetota bacterium]